jgi:hypothetical protein
MGMRNPYSTSAGINAWLRFAIFFVALCGIIYCAINDISAAWMKDKKAWQDTRIHYLR